MSAVLGTLLRKDQSTMDRGAVIMTDVRRELPEQDERGDSAVWEIRDRDGKLHTVSGAFLGIGSSHRPWHKGHPGEEWAPKRVHCSTCRWTEIRLFRLDDGTFLVVNSGMSDVPGERQRRDEDPCHTCPPQLAAAGCRSRCRHRPQEATGSASSRPIRPAA